MRTLAIVLSIAACLATISAPRGAAAQDDDDQLSRVVTRLLMSRRAFPPRRVFMRAAPPAEVNRVLADIANNRHAEHRIRLNAMRALEYFPTRRTEEVLMTLLYVRHQQASIKRVALRALARAFGVRMYFEILPFLREKDPRVREGAALAMGEIDDERVKGILAGHIVHEQDIDVRLAIERAMEMIDRRMRTRPIPNPVPVDGD